MTYGHLRADCLYIRISSGPNAWYQVWESLYLYLYGLTYILTYLLICVPTKLPQGGIQELTMDDICRSEYKYRYATAEGDRSMVPGENLKN